MTDPLSAMQATT